ncbi:MAG TPA: gamma-glutamyltransferase [Eoetvoesiella sp.]
MSVVLKRRYAIAFGLLCALSVGPVAAVEFSAQAVEKSDALTVRGLPAAAVGDINPEAATARTDRVVVRAAHYMITTANPLATQAGADILARGGSAADAVIAAQMVLNLVEPQSSGIGGGGFIVSFDASEQRMRAYDGRETAPALARSNRFMQDNKAIPFWDAVNSGLSVGVPGLIRSLALMHEHEGKLPWKALFQPAINIASEGFFVSPRLHALLDQDTALRRQAAAAAYFYDEKGAALPVGYRLTNPALAKVFQEVAQKGPDAFYTGSIAQDIVNAVASHSVPGDLALTDLSRYRAVQREPLCSAYFEYKLCGMPPPSAGPLAVIQILGLLTHTPITQLEPASLESVHYFSEAGKLAYADRDAFVADPDFADVPVNALLDPAYMARRAALIQPGRSMGRASAGDPVNDLAFRGSDTSPELPSTTHIAAIDAQGNVVSMTSSIESAFGSKIFVRGFLLNNQLTDFSLSDVDEHGKLVVNRVQPFKRPRSSMSPMIILKYNKPYMAIGSPGGSAIINYVAKTILAVLNWNLNIQEAIDLPNFGSRNRGVELEKGTSLHALVPGLRAMGHNVREVDFPSGLQGFVVTPNGIEGGADPRREGLALGR